MEFKHKNSRKLEKLNRNTLFLYKIYLCKSTFKRVLNNWSFSHVKVTRLNNYSVIDYRGIDLYL